MSAARLAGSLSVSRRTVYRDIQTLRALGAPIDGEAGVGFVLGRGFLLPPLMFSAEQIEAIVLGARMVSRLDDQPLALAALDALVKIAAVLPGDGRETVAAVGLLSGPRPPAVADGVALAGLRAAIRAEHRVEIDYSDEAGHGTTRYIWPIALTFGNQVRLLAAWCEVCEDFRTFRVAQCLNGGHGWLEVKCHRCETKASIPLDAIRRPRTTPIWKLEASLKCRSCRKGRYAPSVHMIRLTEQREIAAYKWVHPDEDR